MKGRPSLISDCHFCLFWNMPKIMPKNTNFSGYRSITEVSIEQIFETYTQG
jgi:hypothetical protein